MWKEAPTPDALLAARVQRGWSPLPSLLAEGPKVLGYAARLVADTPSPGGAPPGGP